MKQFFKFMFASALGLVLGIFLLFGILAGIGASMGDKQKVEVKDNSVLHLKLDQQIQERGKDNPFGNLNAGPFGDQGALGLNDILSSLENAANDDKIKGIYLDVQSIPAGMATVEEIRNGLLKFKESGKWIVSYSEIYTQKAYYVVSVSDEIWLNPEGMLEWKGLGAQLMFMKGMFEKLEVEPQIIRYGKFKSAIEPLILDKMSEANRMQTMTYLSDLWNKMLAGVAEGRGKTVAELDGYSQNATIQDADDALEYGLVDELLYKDQVIEKLREKMGITDEDEKVNYIGLGKYKDAPKAKGDDDDKATRKEKIAVIYAVGSIEGGNGDDETIGSETISKEIRKAREDDKIKAIVLRVNSPGGSALASDVMWREIVLAKEVKPVVVSMGDVAASGGYYISCAADSIFAQPNTITGSIGVFGVLMNAQKMVNNKLGITIDTVKTNKFADLGTPFRPLTETERGIIQKGVNDIYTDFITKVAEGRGMKVADVDSIGQGRVWSGEDALEIGLVDRLGGIDDAIACAARMAEVENYRVLEFPEKKDPFQQMVEDLTGKGEEALLKHRLGSYYEYVKDVEELMNMEGVQARLPYQIYID
ncbi:MAG: signal peptide peptidase SppA [Flavobacteriales bacterium]|nr:signal peptide peptidase SppA [Flavobacteriales bacterium]MCB9204738.1 signal peptide peptidase SppA [Flavobacteriales bacterium]